jgi:beta-mannosidase
VSTHATRDLHDGWSLCSVDPDAARTPEALALLAPAWQSAIVPGTVATSMQAAGALDLDHASDFDARDWWYRGRFAGNGPVGDATDVLCLDGLASLADVWLNGVHVLSSENMFVTHEVDVKHLLGADNEIVMRFRSLNAACAASRGRPRWKTKLVERQQLRWHRTTLLGRMPGWSPSVRPVGPWRAVRLERRATIDVVSGEAYPFAQTRGGAVEALLVIRPISGAHTLAATLTVGGKDARLAMARGPNGDVTLRGTLALPKAAHWWPHTHGDQPRYDARVTVETTDGEVEIALGQVAFRRLAVDRSEGGFALKVNEAPVFCRGACWTPPDIVSLDADPESYRRLLTLARDAGMNMLRVGGTMVYESDAFYDLCDELGILVWQDFMFANMDYPAGDAAFAASVKREAENVLARVRRHPSLAVLCGNSEVEQQAAMLGLPPEMWSNSLFQELLPSAVAAAAPGMPYWPGSPSGGALPFHTDAGVAHYYGVGAYLRPLDDARRANVRFAAECLGFANVPEPRMVDELLPNGESPVHHPRWKARVPRDHGAGWDFEDVRDHYLARLFDVDPMRLRYSDMERYLALSRVATGAVIEQTIGEWRRGASTCRGALIWFFRDLWAGAGWGLVDSDGRPKAAYYAAKRAMQPVSLSVSDEGANGVHLHVCNDRAAPLDAELRVTLWRGGSTTAPVGAPLRIDARSTATVAADALFRRFHDTAYAYRFGPPGHDALVATLLDETGVVLGEAVHFPAAIPTARADEPIVSATAARLPDGTVAITLRAERFAQSVWIDAGDFTPDDNYFHLTPDRPRVVLARAHGEHPRFVGFVQALNAREGVAFSAIEILTLDAPPPLAGAVT